uniref:Uncharacterized protein n=1 Tax=Rhizophora mucronata TaxID=61149 RepID=A0A2P2P071_RHIMU
MSFSRISRLETSCRQGSGKQTCGPKF